MKVLTFDISILLGQSLDQRVDQVCRAAQKNDQDY